MMCSVAMPNHAVNNTYDRSQNSKTIKVTHLCMVKEKILPVLQSRREKSRTSRGVY